MSRNASTRPVAIDLFAGAGGMSLGFEQAGFDVVAAVELDPVHCAVHEFNFPECRILCKNIRDVRGTDFIEFVKAKERKIDVVFGGPPCQGFSMMGKRSIDDPRNRLVRDFIRIVGETNAKAFVFENVKGLTVGKQVQFLKEMIAEFEDLGYQLSIPWRVLNAVNFGVPQDRQRLFLIGTRHDLPAPRYPEYTTHRPTAEDELFHLPATPTVLDAIGDLPDIERYDELLAMDSVEVSLSTPSIYAALLRGEIEDPFDFSYPRIWNPAIMTSAMRTKHTEIARQRFAETAHGQTEPVSRFFKLDPNGVSNTLRAGTASDRGAFTSPRPIHPYCNRCITVREAARLHSYPDWFRFHVTKWHGARQIGNSVPPLLARAVAASVRACLGHEITKPERFVQLGDPALLQLTMQQACGKYKVPGNVIPQRNRKSVPIIGANLAR